MHNMNESTFLKCISLGLLMNWGASLHAKVDFKTEVRPKLAKHCFACHGPDKESREANLRLDTFEGAIEDHDGVRALVPGKPDESELLYRVTTIDPDDIMPPPDDGLPL